MRFSIISRLFISLAAELQNRRPDPDFVPQVEHHTQPEGLQESSRWSESAETTGKVVSHDRTPEGCKTSQ